MELLTREEAMNYLRIKSPTTFRKYEREGLIKSLKPKKGAVTNRKRYSTNELDKVFI